MGESTGLTAIDGHSAGRDDDDSVRGGGDVDDALIDDGTAGVGVGRGKRQDAVTRLGQAHGITGTVVGDDGIDDHIADADGPALVGLGGDGGTGDGDLGGAVDGDDVGADRDARAGDGHAGADAHGRIHGDRGRTRGRGAGDEGSASEGLINPRSNGVRAERDLRVGIHRNDGGTRSEISVGDRHTRAQTKGVDAADDRRT